MSNPYRIYDNPHGLLPLLTRAVYSSSCMPYHNVEKRYDGRNLPNWPPVVQKILSYREQLQQEVDWWLRGALPY